MMFLVPLGLLGLVGVAAPLWLHLRRRHRTNVRSFAALRFLDDQPAPRDMPLRVREWPLFLLRLLALVLAVLALAGLMFNRSAAAEGETEVRIYLLDNTLSHRVDGAFERARREVAREVRSAPSGAQVGVIEIAARCRVVAELGGDRAEGAAAVEALEPTHQRGSYLEAFRLAAGMLDRSLGERRRILVSGDRQRNQWEENLSVPPFLENVEVVMAEAAGRNGAGNLYTATTRVGRKLTREAAVTELTLDLGAQEANGRAEIVVRSGEREVVRQDLALDAGNLTVRANWKDDSKGWVRGEVELKGEPDALREDDRSYFAVPPLEPGRIGLIARSPYLRASLDPEISAGVWDVTRLTPDEIRAEAGADAPGFDAVVVESDYLQSAEVRGVVLKHLNNGRGVVLFVSRTTPLVEGFLRTLGFSGGEVVDFAAEGSAFRYAAFSHPALSAYSRQDFGDLLAVRVRKYLALAAEEADGILFAGDGVPVAFETRGTKGRMLVFGFGADAEWTNWVLRPDFLPFLDGCLTHVRAAPELQTSVEPGEVLYRVMERGAGVEFALADDGGREATRAVADEAGRLRIVAPDAPGIYELRRSGGAGGAGVQHGAKGPEEKTSLVSVSPDSAESVLDYIEGTPAAVAAWTLQAKDAPVVAPARAVTAVAGREETLWWWLLLGGAGLLLAEMIWTNRRGETA